ncbi:MAG: hypothetical protein DRP27_05320 [Thermotogae bacterium]|nr:MAG: hypothetical protein DRP27_05320 [Thermotogota bacterium]
MGSGGDTYRVVTISRSKPTDEVTETGTITVEAYTDSEYTNKIDEATLNVTIEVVNIKTWTVLGWTFDDGTSQGWTISGEISDERSVITGGYSMRHHAYSGETTAYIEKTIALPSGTKCIGIVYIKGRCWANRYIAWRVTKVVVKVNGNIIYEWKGASFYDTNGNVGSAEFPWRKIAFDLSQYTDQTITLRIEVTAETYYCADGCNQVIYLDDPTIGVK